MLMPDPSDEMKALDEAFEKAGGVGALAVRLSVVSSAPSMWRARGRVPAEHCPAIERETGVRCERLRPDIPWDVLRIRAANGEPWDGVDRRANPEQQGDNHGE
jgi:DNA-binding transcriptional regulator YdaS (Cro superfamily)